MVPPQVAAPDASSVAPAEEAEAPNPYAAEFAKLVERCTPSRQMTPSLWLWQIPNEAFRYYRGGLRSFGSGASTTTMRRGRVYLVQTTLLFMWMSWGEETAQERFRSHLDKGVRRTASLVMLEYYRRGGVVAHYEVPDWFFEPVVRWTMTLVSSRVRTENVSDPDLRDRLREQETVGGRVSALSSLRSDGALPELRDLSLE